MLLTDKNKAFADHKIVQLFFHIMLKYSRYVPVIIFFIIIERWMNYNNSSTRRNRNIDYGYYVC